MSSRWTTTKELRWGRSRSVILWLKVAGALVSPKGITVNSGRNGCGTLSWEYFSRQRGFGDNHNREDSGTVKLIQDRVDPGQGVGVLHRDGIQGPIVYAKLGAIALADEQDRGARWGL
jgi:hypothetical protein